MTATAGSRVTPPRAGGSPGADGGAPRRAKHEPLGPTPRRSREELLSGKRQPGTESLWGLLAAFGFLVAAIVLAVFSFDTQRSTLGGFLLLPILAALVTPLIRWVARDETRIDLRGVLYLGLVARAVGAVLRYRYLAADSLVYDQEGARIATSLRALDFTVETGRQIPGTGTVRYMAGIVHVFVFDDPFGSFMFFTTLSFVGACLFIKAFQVGVPNGDIRRYALLVALLPSLLFWPSSIGKEALMVCTLGLTSLGVAYLLQQRWTAGAVIILIGMGTTALVRPHVALIALLGVATTVWVPRERKSTTRFMARIFVVVLVLFGGSLLARETATLFNKDDRSGESVNVDDALTSAEDQTSQGGSKFTPVRVRTPLDYPLAFGTVFFRPLPIEARDLNAAISSGETLLIGALALMSLRRYARLWATVKESPYVAYALAFVLAFAFAFSAIGNFGILARQRTQALPLLLVLLALPIVARSTGETDDGPDTDRARSDRLQSAGGRGRSSRHTAVPTTRS